MIFSPHKTKTSVKQLELLILSDLHGRLISATDTATKKPKAGLDRFSTYLNRLRNAGREVFVLNNGDAIQGSSLVDLHNFEEINETLQQHPLNIAQNYLKVDCFIPGNHEFNFGVDFLKKVQKGSNAPWISANVYSTKTGNLFFEPFRIFQYKHLRLGVIGLVTDFVAKWESKNTISGLEFRDAVEACQAYIPIVRPQCDVLIVAYHGGLRYNPITGDRWSVSSNSENQAIEIWEYSNQIDILITGHQHRELVYQPINQNRATIIQPSYFAKHWAHIAVRKNNNKGQNTNNNIVVDLKPGIVKALSEKPDPKFNILFNQHLLHTKKILNTPVGFVDSSFSIKDPMKDVWLKKHSLIQWINDLMSELTKVEISAIPLLSPQLKGLSGEVTIDDILTFFFFQDTVCVMEITGKILKSALEKSAQFFQVESDKKGGSHIGINPDWRKSRVLSYNYDMWNGIEYCFDIRKPFEKRLIFLKLNGFDVKDDQILNVAVTSYRSGGAFYNMFSPDLIKQEFPDRITDLMIDDLRNKIKLTNHPTQNFSIRY